jgi:hypothetical protein
MIASFPTTGLAALCLRIFDTAVSRLRRVTTPFAYRLYLPVLRHMLPPFPGSMP